MPTVKSFNDVDKIVTNLIEVKKRDFMLGLWNELVDRTPVKSGKARASWKISVGFAATKELPVGTYGRPKTPDLTRYKRNYQNWYLTNSAPYISRLNTGYSKQAPAGFINSIIQKHVAKANA